MKLAALSQPWNPKSIPLKHLKLHFSGYLLDPDLLPSRSLIYVVYACRYDRFRNEVAIRELIYIGESGDGNDRHQDHEMLEAWQTYLRPGENLCYSQAPVDPYDRNRAEAALIYEHQPPSNTNYKASFPFELTFMHLTGEIEQLRPNFCAPISALLKKMPPLKTNSLASLLGSWRISDSQ